ncbi:retinol-binding protein pinta-like isoform X1 [Schistocerca cancellata]|uniref:retinol-binding protein pinta-like isoform X1 n=2 Tax=Schistocerca cancellata TaxID=274614 RepID=UPI0021176E88|nr:retinol-binding protein pinta-like isoform X1 [Schistocerca cancellata]XP_049784796.1 retinol-binding protein pinta-like isoform X1 [Schistocerca cancellata]XP_049784797.1 retinol-binding protein pinta-like isoform X1 [Schistocerca cancellata]
MATAIEFKLPTEEQKALVRQKVGTTEEDIRQAVSSLRSWLLAQPHLPHLIDDGRLERMYISCKCSIEKSKKMLDAYYTLKNRFPELLLNRDPLGDDIQDIIKYVTLVIMPRLTEDGHRVTCLTDICPDATNMEMFMVSKLKLMATEYILSFDYSIGYIIIMDMKNLSAAHVMKIGVRDIRALETIVRRAYSRRIVAVHLINAPKVIDMLLSIVYPAIPEKLRSRIHVHLPGSQELFKHVDRDLVPNEMGGTGGASRDLMAGLMDRMVALRDWYREEDKHVVDETRRPADSQYDYELFGVDGSFKKLQVD